MADNINKIKKVNGKDIVVDWNKIENKPDNLATEEYVDTEPRETIYLTNNMRIESRIENGIGGIWLVSDDNGEMCLFDGNIYSNYSDEASCAWTDVVGRDLKGTRIEEYGNEQDVDVVFYDGDVMSFGIVSNSIIVSFSEEYQNIGFLSGLYFTTPSTIPENYTQFPADIYFDGDSTDEGAFIPESDTRYTIVFDFDGYMLNGYVKGVPAPPVSEVTENE